MFQIRMILGQDQQVPLLHSRRYHATYLLYTDTAINRPTSKIHCHRQIGNSEVFQF